MNYADIAGFHESTLQNAAPNVNATLGAKKRRKKMYIPDWSEQPEPQIIQSCKYCHCFAAELDKYGWCPECQKTEVDNVREN